MQMATTLRDRVTAPEMRGVGARPVPRILVVEDGRGLYTALRADVFYERYLVDAAGGAAHARELTRMTRYDLVVVQLGRAESLDLCRALRLDGSTAPLIVLSTRMEQDDVIAALSAGADDCLPATVHQDELRARLRSLYRRYRFSENLGAMARAQLTARYRVGTI